jgi:hypothetical protein
VRKYWHGKICFILLFFFFPFSFILFYFDILVYFFLFCSFIVGYFDIFFFFFFHFLLLIRGQDVSKFSPPFDIIIAAECIYFVELAPILCKTLKELSDLNTEIYVSYEKHNEEGVETFWREVTKLFNISQISYDELPQSYRSERITLLRMKLKLA